MNAGPANQHDNLIRLLAKRSGGRSRLVRISWRQDLEIVGAQSVDVLKFIADDLIHRGDIAGVSSDQGAFYKLTMQGWIRFATLTQQARPDTGHRSREALTIGPGDAILDSSKQEKRDGKDVNPESGAAFLRKMFEDNAVMACLCCILDAKRQGRMAEAQFWELALGHMRPDGVLMSDFALEESVAIALREIAGDGAKFLALSLANQARERGIEADNAFWNGVALHLMSPDQGTVCQ